MLGTCTGQALCIIMGIYVTTYRFHGNDVWCIVEEVDVDEIEDTEERHKCSLSS